MTHCHIGEGFLLTSKKTSKKFLEFIGVPNKEALPYSNCEKLLNLSRKYLKTENDLKFIYINHNTNEDVGFNSAYAYITEYGENIKTFKIGLYQDGKKEATKENFKEEISGNVFVNMKPMDLQFYDLGDANENKLMKYAENNDIDFILIEYEKEKFI